MPPFLSAGRIAIGHQRIYVTNTEPTILRQIRRCLQHYYALVKGRAFWVDFLPDFTSPKVRE